MSKDTFVTKEGALLSIDGVMYVVSFYPSQNGKQDAETQINRAFLKEMKHEQESQFI